MEEAALNLSMTPQSDRYNEKDDRWLGQVAGLRRDVHEGARKKVGAVASTAARNTIAKSAAI